MDFFTLEKICFARDLEVRMGRNYNLTSQKKLICSGKKSIWSTNYNFYCERKEINFNYNYLLLSAAERKELTITRLF